MNIRLGIEWKIIILRIRQKKGIRKIRDHYEMDILEINEFFLKVDLTLIFHLLINTLERLLFY